MPTRASMRHDNKSVRQLVTMCAVKKRVNRSPKLKRYFSKEERLTSIWGREFNFTDQ
ncbi:mCG147047 [Mus musculus]|nr:mCG147047 [Mus musculus]